MSTIVFTLTELWIWNQASLHNLSGHNLAGEIKRIGLNFSRSTYKRDSVDRCQEKCVRLIDVEI